jgi:hypothetical protein
MIPVLNTEFIKKRRTTIFHDLKNSNHELKESWKPIIENLANLLNIIDVWR